MKRPRQRTLRQNLIRITLITAGLALLVMGAVMIAAAFSSFRQGITRDLAIKAEIMGDQSAAALLFHSRKDAEEILRSLRADPHIEAAAVYTREGSLFAAYHRDDPPRGAPASPPPDGRVIGISHLALTHPVMLHGERIGSIFIRSDLRNLYALLRPYAAAALLTLAAAFVIAYGLVSRMLPVITRPVSRLVWLMDHVSRDKDFTLRAEPAGPAELASLARGFNDMLTTIEDRDRELAVQRRHLEETVLHLERSAAQLEEANRKLKNLDKLKSDFVSTVSHELRTPLTSIKAFVELILVKRSMSEERKLKLLRTIDRESDRLGRLINDLLDLSRIEAGIVQWRLTDVAMDDIIRASVDGLMPLASGKSQTILVTHRDPVPRLQGDRDRLIQVVTNILSNAVKFTPEGGRITVETSRKVDPHPELVVKIVDSGPGIPEEEIGMIFDKFHRVEDTLTRSIEGTGLGLSIARQIVEHHGGRIWARNNEDGGSTFFLSLPLESAAA